ncbi:PREDICTED: rho GTPase-activating protein 28-like [Thamnophis sirtalis]|uniref:Rho GTPase-activating protein 28-like n=1 Tax=Thamnophis sirtalis TaxID=35019 RepID=A0A6I9YET8_9SAUR|nr:PREDICTED: rho GTPase-activating protein 28-like [Thamnophis sirtalis]
MKKMDKFGKHGRYGFVRTRFPRPQIILQPVLFSGHPEVCSTRNCPCKMNHFSRKSSSELPQLEYRPSQTDSSNNLAMDTFWLEVESIKESTESESDEGSLTEAKVLEEGEAEAEWLQDAGLSDLMKDHEENSNIVLLSTLTKTQAAAVQRRLDTYTRSRRKKNKQPIRDVRDIFGVVESGETEPAMEAEMDRSHRRSASSNNLQKCKEHYCIAMNRN